MVLGISIDQKAAYFENTNGPLTSTSPLLPLESFDSTPPTFMPTEPCDKLLAGSIL
jgi:hypothetical protein